MAHINIESYIDKGVVADKNAALAVEYVLRAFEIGDKWDDPRSVDATLNRNKWSPEFWRIMQQKLTERGHYNGPIDGRLTEATKAAFDKIVDK